MATCCQPIPGALGVPREVRLCLLLADLHQKPWHSRTRSSLGSWSVRLQPSTARRRISAAPARAVPQGSVLNRFPEPRASEKDTTRQKFLLNEYFFKLGFTQEDLQLLLGGLKERTDLDYDKVAQVGSFFTRYGVRKKDLKGLYLKFPEIVESDVSKTMQPVMDTLKNSMPFELLPDDLTRMLSTNPTFLLLSPDQVLKVATYLHDLDIDCVRVLRKFPEILSRSVEQDLQPLIDYLQGLAMGKLAIGVLLSKEPALGAASVEGNLKSVVKFLQDTGVGKGSISTCLARGPFMFARSVEKHLKPKVEYLLEMGVDGEEVAKLLVMYPSIFKNDLKTRVKDLVTFFGQRGVDKLNVLHMITKFPSLVGYVHETMAQKVDYLLQEGWTIEDVIDFPQVTGYSLEDRIVPRLQAVRKMGIQGLRLPSILACKEEDFKYRLTSYWVGKYSSPMPNVGDSH